MTYLRFSGGLVLTSLVLFSCGGGDEPSQGDDLPNGSGGTVDDATSTGGTGTGGGAATGGAATGGTGTGGEVATGGASTGGAASGGAGTGGEPEDLGDVQYCAFETMCWEFVTHSMACLVPDKKNCYSFGGEVYAAGPCPEKFSVLAAEDNTGCGLTLTRELP